MLSLNYGELPEPAAVIAACKREGADPYNVNPSRSGFDTLAAAVNQGIDSHLEAVFCKPNSRRGGFDIEARSMPVLLRRLVELWEAGDENAGDLASCILETLDIEWI